MSGLRRIVRPPMAWRNVIRYNGPPSTANSRATFPSSIDNRLVSDDVISGWRRERNRRAETAKLISPTPLYPAFDIQRMTVGVLTAVSAADKGGVISWRNEFVARGVSYWSGSRYWDEFSDSLFDADVGDNDSGPWVPTKSLLLLMMMLSLEKMSLFLCGHDI